MKKHLKLIKNEESYDMWKDSDEAGYPHVAIFEDNHPETPIKTIIYVKEKGLSFPITLIPNTTTEEALKLFNYIINKSNGNVEYSLNSNEIIFIEINGTRMQIQAFNYTDGSLDYIESHRLESGWYVEIWKDGRVKIWD